jgi:hypothetical protein
MLKLLPNLPQARKDIELPMVIESKTLKQEPKRTMSKPLKLEPARAIVRQDSVLPKFNASNIEIREPKRSCPMQETAEPSLA